ncbi:MAG: Omp28-related outer membrane protein, partial [Chlorobi bacterium]|nr:Omp28-related outer membrane protein [Chlorobiota bacterium]
MRLFHRLLSRTVGVGAILLLLCASISQAQWVDAPSLPPSNPPGLLGASGEYYDGKIYVFGGVSGGQFTTASWTLNVAGGATSWMQGTRMSETNYFSSSAVLDDKIYIFGGLVNDNTFSTAVQAFDPSTTSFSQPTELPRPSWRAVTVGIGSKAYIIGGVTLRNNQSIITQSMLVFDATTDNVTEITTGAPYSGYDQAATVIDSTIYVVGGQDARGALNLAYMGRVSTDGNSINWTRMADLPSAMALGVAGSLNGKLIVAGGISQSQDIRSAYLYDYDNDKWEPYYLTPVTDLASPIMTGDGDTPYLIGGSNNNMVWKATEGEPAPVAIYNQDNIFASVLTDGMTTEGVSITNGGVVPLSVSVSIPPEAKDWLSASPQDIAPGSTSDFDFSIDASSLPADSTYNATATLTTNDMGNSTHDVNVFLYVGDPAVDQETRVVFEEGSGDWCPWCPAGHEVMKEVEEQFGEKVIVLSYHGGSRDEPLMISEGTQILNALQLSGWPNGSINRITFPGESGPMVGRGRWAEYVRKVLTTQPTAQASIEVEDYNFDPNSRKVTATVNVTTAVWTSSERLRLNAVIKEQGIYTWQADVNGPHSSYEQPHTVRQVWPDAIGRRFRSDTEGHIPPGTTLTQKVEFTVPASSGYDNIEIDPANSQIVFFVHRNDGSNYGEILQGYERELEGQTTPGPSLSIDWGTTAKEFLSGDTAEYNFMVTNTRSEPANIKITREENDLPPGWSSEICTGTNDCNDATTVNYTIPVDGSHTFTLKVKSKRAETGETGNVR